MRFNLRFHGLTSTGQRCVADVSVYANSADDLKHEAHQAATTAPWHLADQPDLPVTDKETITIEHVETLGKPKSKR